MNTPSLTAAERRTALKAALRAVANIADIADRVTGKRNLSALTVQELDAVAQAAKLDVSSLAAPVRAASPAPVQPDAVDAVDADTLADAPPVPAQDDTPAVDTGAVDAEVARILSSSFADMPAALRALAVRAHTPTVIERVVEVERVVEKIVHDTLPVASVPGEIAVAPVVSKSVVKIKRIATASEIFEVSSPHLDRIQVAVYNDPGAPPVDAGYAFDPEILALALWRLAAGQSILVSGPKGTGKTTFVEQIAARLGRYFALLSFDRTTEIDPLIGQIELANGNTFFRDGALTAAMRRPGSIILFDEPDMAKAGALAALHPVLANRSILVPRTGERVDCAKGVWFAAAANTTGHGDATGTYVDRNLLDAAFRDRFADIVLIPYPSAATERRIVCERTGLSKTAAGMLVAYARATRERADKEQDIAAGVGLRRLLAWASGLLSGLSADLIFRSTIVNQHSAEEGEVLWQLYKSTVDQAALVAAVSAPDSEEAASDDNGGADIL